MENLMIRRTTSTPAIEFNASSGILKIQGESFPENAAKFYSPVLAWVRSYFAADPGKTVMEIDVLYFNSSTSKIFITLFDMLEKEVTGGKDVVVNWKCDRDNRTGIECGEEFKMDVSSLPFNIVES